MKDAGVPVEVTEFLANTQNHPLVRRQQDALGISAAESNCGTKACPTFDAEGMQLRGGWSYAAG